MKLWNAISVGTLAVALGVAAPAFAQPSTVPVSDSTMGKGAGTGSPTDTTIPSDQRTDLTKGRKGGGEDYADTPVAQGSLVELKDSPYKNATVHSLQGEAIGKIKEVLKDSKTGEIEYAIVIPNETQRPVPLRWSQIEKKNDRLQLSMNKEELRSSVNMTNNKDLSPDLKQYMDSIDRVRSQPTVPGNPSVPGQKGSEATGSMGEESVGGSGPSGTSGLPPGKAPGFEGGHPSSKQ